jgi:hypothetical protein
MQTHDFHLRQNSVFTPFFAQNCAKTAVVTERDFAICSNAKTVYTRGLHRSREAPASRPLFIGLWPFCLRYLYSRRLLRPRFVSSQTESLQKKMKTELSELSQRRSHGAQASNASNLAI